MAEFYAVYRYCCGKSSHAKICRFFSNYQELILQRIAKFLSLFFISLCRENILEYNTGALKLIKI